MEELLAEILKAQSLPHFTDVVKKNSGLYDSYYQIDTCYTVDHGWESMVFACNANGKVSNFEDFDCAHYDSEEEARAGHEAMIAKWSH